MPTEASQTSKIDDADYELQLATRMAFRLYPRLVGYLQGPWLLSLGFIGLQF